MYANSCSIFIPTASSLHQRRCPNPGRYAILDIVASPLSDNTQGRHSGRQRRADDDKLSSRRRRRRRRIITKRRTWQEDEEECRSTSIQVGCTSSDQSEMIIANTCDHGESKFASKRLEFARDRYFFLLYSNLQDTTCAIINGIRENWGLGYIYIYIFVTFRSLFLSRQLGGEGHVVHDSFETEQQILGCHRPTIDRRNLLLLYASRDCPRQSHGKRRRRRWQAEAAEAGTLAVELVAHLSEKRRKRMDVQAVESR